MIQCKKKMYKYPGMGWLVTFGVIICFNLSIAQDQSDQATEKLSHFHDAVNSSDAVEVRRLLENGADVNAVSKDGMTPLMSVVNTGNSEIVKLLLNAGAKVDMKTSSDTTALILATKNGYAEIVKLLLNAGAYANTGPYSRKISINAPGNTPFITPRIITTPLTIASENGYTGIVKLLLEAGAKVNTKTSFDTTALILASKNGCTEIVKLLLDAGANPNIATKRYSIYLDDYRIKKEGFLYSEIPVKSTPLILASERGYTEIVQLLLDAKPRLNLKRNDGATALMQACANGHTDIVKLLLEAGAKVNDRLVTADVFLTRSGISYAQSHSHKYVGATHLYLQRMGRSTPLILASANGYAGIVKLLIEAGAKVNAKTTGDYTALILAVQNSHADIVNLLLKAGAKTSAGIDLDGTHYTVLDLAERRADAEILKLLKEYETKE